MGRVILDSGAVTSLAGCAQEAVAVISGLRRRNIWPPVVPSVVLVECLSGRQSTDALTNRFLKTCEIDERLPESVAGEQVC